VFLGLWYKKEHKGGKIRDIGFFLIEDQNNGNNHFIEEFDTSKAKTHTSK